MPTALLSIDAGVLRLQQLVLEVVQPVTTSSPSSRRGSDRPSSAMHDV